MAGNLKNFQKTGKFKFLALIFIFDQKIFRRDGLSIDLYSGHSQLIITILSDVSDPWKCLVAGFFDDFQIADLQKIKDFF